MEKLSISYFLYPNMLIYELCFLMSTPSFTVTRCWQNGLELWACHALPAIPLHGNPADLREEVRDVLGQGFIRRAVDIFLSATQSYSLSGSIFQKLLRLSCPLPTPCDSPEETAQMSEGQGHPLVGMKLSSFAWLIQKFRECFKGHMFTFSFVALRSGLDQEGGKNTKQTNKPQDKYAWEKETIKSKGRIWFFLKENTYFYLKGRMTAKKRDLPCTSSRPQWMEIGC